MREIFINQPQNFSRVESIQLVEAHVDENNRLLSQGGVFTQTPDGLDIEEYILKYLDLTGMPPILYRIEIPESQREVFLRHLEAMNIHSGTLFPDLAGAAEFSNRGLEKEWSELFWRQNPEFIRRMLSSDVAHD